MKSKLNLSDDGKILTITYSGYITIEDLVESHKARLDHNNGETIRKIRVMIVDYCDVKGTDLSAEDLKRDLEVVTKMAAVNPYITVISISPNPLEYGLGRMWQAYAEYESKLSWKSHVVRTFKEAEAITKAVLPLDNNLDITE